MAMVCGKCKAYDAEGSVTTCPTCELPMQFTLLPRSGGSAPPPLPLTAAPPAPRRVSMAEKANGVMDMVGTLFRFRFIFTLVLLPLLLTGGFFGFQLFGDTPRKDPNDPFEIRGKFDEVQNKLNHPEPIAGFQPAFQPGTQMYQPPPQAVFNNNVPGVRVPQPPAPPPPIVNPRNFNGRR